MKLAKFTCPINFRFVGDPVDGIPFKKADYSKEPRVLHVPLTREASVSKLPDTEDVEDVGGSPTPGPKDLELGFDLVSTIKDITLAAASA